VSYPNGMACSTAVRIGTTSFVAGPGVLTATGIPAGLEYPGIYGADWITGHWTGPTGPAGLSEGTVNGEPVTWLVQGTIDPVIGQPSWNPTQGPGQSFRFVAGTPGTATLTPIGSFPPFTFGLYSVLSPHCPPLAGPMPAGLTLNADGTITGTATTPGNYATEIYMLDAQFNGQIGPLNILVAPAAGGALAFDCGGPGPGTVGVAYPHSYPASGGTLPYAFALVSGVFPPGVSLDGSTGLASGIPGASGTFAVRLSVTDAVGATVAIDCSITIAAAAAATVLYLPGPNASPIPLPDPTKGPCK